MKLFRLLPAVFILFGACSNFSVKKDINDLSYVKGSKKLGVVVRSTLKSRISRDELMTTLSRTLNGYKHITAIEFVPDLSAQMTDFSIDEERFFQSVNDSDFQKYKSIGVVKSYVRSNNDEIQKIITKNSLDGIILYEEYAIISVEMQLMRMNSVISIIDKKGNIAYLDHQDDKFSSIETDIVSLKSEMLNNLSMRFVEKMKDLDFIKNL